MQSLFNTHLAHVLKKTTVGLLTSALTLGTPSVLWANTPAPSSISVISGAKPAPLQRSKAAQQTPSAPININQATAASLAQHLIGIGPAKAQAIVDYRSLKGPFTSPQQLLEVKGIGPATLEKNLSRIQL